MKPVLTEVELYLIKFSVQIRNYSFNRHTAKSSASISYLVKTPMPCYRFLMNGENTVFESTRIQHSYFHSKERLVGESDPVDYIKANY